ncbi:MAG: nucleotidyltransferase [bacterium]
MLKILTELKKVNLEAILVGGVACALQGVPIMTQDIDFFIRDTELNKRKISRFAENLNWNLVKFNNAITEVIRVEGKEVVVDFVFRQGLKQTFENIRSRTKKIKIGNMFCKAASLEDILYAKTSVGRDKDKAILKIIQDTICIKNNL